MDLETHNVVVQKQADGAVERVRALGVSGASPIDLIAIGFSRREEDVQGAETMARQLLTRYDRFQRFAQLSPKDIGEQTGLSNFELLKLQALMELGRRSALAGPGELDVVDRPDDVARLFPHLRREKREHFCLILLDAQNQLIGTRTIHIGTLTMSVVGPREVFREAIREGASAIIAVHNHPSGDTTPSIQDLEITQKLAEVGAMLDIPLLDHVIIGDPRTRSLRQTGCMKNFSEPSAQQKAAEK